MTACFDALSAASPRMPTTPAGNEVVHNRAATIGHHQNPWFMHRKMLHTLTSRSRSTPASSTPGRRGCSMAGDAARKVQSAVGLTRSALNRSITRRPQLMILMRAFPFPCLRPAERLRGNDDRLKGHLHRPRHRH